jgi:hypothetical protein
MFSSENTLQAKACPLISCHLRMSSSRNDLNAMTSLVHMGGSVFSIASTPFNCSLSATRAVAGSIMVATCDVTRVCGLEDGK